MDYDIDNLLETHYVIVESFHDPEMPEAVKEVENRLGTGGLWLLSSKLAREFEDKNKGREWEDGTWLETLQEFIELKYKEGFKNYL